jgi:hypothetical protein
MIELIVGRKYHVTWADKTKVWRLVEVNDQSQIATLKTTRGKIITTHIKTLYNVNQNLIT